MFKKAFRMLVKNNTRRTWGYLGPVFGCLGPVLGCVGPVLGSLGLVLDGFGPVLGHLGAISGHSRAILGYPGAVLGHLGPFWGCVGPSWNRLAPSWRFLGSGLGPSWVVLVLIRDVLAPFWTCFEVFWAILVAKIGLATIVQQRWSSTRGCSRREYSKRGAL